MSQGTPVPPADDIVPGIVEESSRLRRDTIGAIEAATGRNVVNYSATSFGFSTEVMAAADIVNLARVVGKGHGRQGVDLVLNSSGGQPEAAEKIIMTLRHFYGDDFRVIVPEFAKSAATIVALGSREILMGFCSELGPIDPQIFVPDESGRGIFRSAHAIVQSVDAWIEKLHGAVQNNEPYAGYLRMLDNVPNLSFVEECRLAQRLAREIATTWLKAEMLKDDPAKADEVADKLARADSLYSHSRAIDHRLAKDELHLNVKYLPPDDPLWNLVWELHIRAHWALLQNRWAKIIESRHTTINVAQM
jgi:hypothetical protein